MEPLLRKAGAYEVEARAGEVTNLGIYRLVLCLYPANLRESWESKMVDAVSQHVADVGLAAWFDAIVDIVRVALLLRATRVALIVLVVSIGAGCTVFYGVLWSLGNSVLRRSPEVTRLCFLRMTHRAVIAFCEWPTSRAKDPIRGGTRRESG